MELLSNEEEGESGKKRRPGSGQVLANQSPQILRENVFKSFNSFNLSNFRTPCLLYNTPLNLERYFNLKQIQSGEFNIL